MFQRFGIRRHKHGTSKRKTTNRRLGSEGLEGRTMMSATPMSLGAATDIPAAEFEGLAQQEAAELRNLAAMGSTAAAASMSPPKAHVDARGTLVIQGCKGDDRVELVANRGVQVAYTHYVNGINIVYEQKFNGVKSIVFLAYNGNNTLYNNTAVPCQAVGGAAVDQFFGGGRADVFFGLGGNDVLDGRAGSDRLCGGTGNDTLIAGGGAEDEKTTVNLLKGGADHDKLFGSIGFDKMYGNGGNDILQDGLGHGYLHGGAGDDVLFGFDYPGATRKLEIHGGRGDNTLIVKPGVYPPKLLTCNDYHNDDIFLPKNQRLKTLDRAALNELLS